MNRRIAALLFGAVWLLGVFRYSIAAPFTVYSFLDDCAYFLLLLCCFLPLQRFGGAVGFLLRFSFCFALSLFFIAAAGFALFFRVPMDYGAATLLRVLGVAFAAAKEAVPLSFLAKYLLVPLPCFFYAALPTQTRPTRRSIIACAVLTCTLILLLSVGGREYERVAVGDDNPLVRILRSVTFETIEKNFSDPQQIVEEIEADLPRLFPAAHNERYQRLHTGYPLYKEPRTPSAAKEKYNIVMIFMESLRAYESSPRIAKKPITPFLNSLADKGLDFSSFYYNGNRTVRGELAALCGALPYKGGKHVYTHFPDLALRCLPEILKEQGYSTHWFSGIDAEYFGGEAFLTRNGIDHFHDQAEIEAAGYESSQLVMGLSDQVIFDYANEKLSRIPQPFFAEILTISNHYPWSATYPVSLPEEFRDGFQELYQRYLGGLYYSDSALKQFFAQAAKQPWYASTIFVIVGDHSVWVFPKKNGNAVLSEAQKVEAFFRGRLVIYSPTIEVPKVIDSVGSQLDIAPTVLDLLGIVTANSFQGESLLVPSRREQALLLNEDVWNIRDQNTYCYSLGTTCFQKQQPFCNPGEFPAKARTSCFKADGDILLPSTTMQTLTQDTSASNQLLSLAEDIFEANNRLILFDRFVPPQ